MEKLKVSHLFCSSNELDICELIVLQMFDLVWFLLLGVN